LGKTYQRIANTSPEAVKADLLGIVESKEKNKRKKKKAAKPRQVAAQTSDGQSVTVVDGEVVADSKPAGDSGLQQEADVEDAEIVEEAPVKPEELEEKIKTIDRDLMQEIETEDEEEEKPAEHEFVAGNPWYDMASQLPIGAWMELKQEGSDTKLRCKLVANIKSLGKLIFANKVGVKVADKKVVEIAEALKKQEARVINDNMIFDQALESVIVNLRKKE
jgi:hypothetical protein